MVGVDREEARSGRLQQMKGHLNQNLTKNRPKQDLERMTTTTKARVSFNKFSWSIFFWFCGLNLFTNALFCVDNLRVYRIL
jgi:hypothetical protein